MLGWHERFSSVIDYQKFFVKFDAYLMLKEIAQTYPDLKWEPFFSFEKWAELSKNGKTSIEPIWNQLIGADTPEEHLQKAHAHLLKLLKLWGSVAIKKNIFTNQPDIVVSIESMAKTEAQKRWQKSLPYSSLEDCYVAYSLSSFASLYSEHTFLFRKSEREILFSTPQDLPEIELAWMRGYLAPLQPRVKAEKTKSLGKTLYRWSLSV